MGWRCSTDFDSTMTRSSIKRSGRSPSPGNWKNRANGSPPNSVAIERMMRWCVTYTFVWVVVHVTAETFVTIELAGISGLRYGAYLMNWPGFVMLTLGAISGRKGRPVSAGLLTAGWSWIAAMFWRATGDRFRFAEFYGGASGKVWGAGKGGLFKGSVKVAHYRRLRLMKWAM
jgi:hypothetical protein